MKNKNSEEKGSILYCAEDNILQVFPLETTNIINSVLEDSRSIWNLG